MKQKPATAPADPNDEIVGLVRTLHETQKRLEELTGGQVDAVLHKGGQSYLLRQAQGRLQESEGHQRRLAATMMAILNALPAHICLLDANGQIISVNDSWRSFALFNNWRQDDPGQERNYLSLCEQATGPGAEDARKTAVGIRAVIAGTKDQFALEYACEVPGKRLWFQVVAAPVGQERPGGAVVMHIDITERKQAEEAMRQSEERFRNMFTAAATGIAISSPQGRFLEVNDAYCRMLGYTEKELQGRDFASITHPDDLALNIKLRDEVLAGQRRSFTMEKRYVRKDGNIVWTRHSVAAAHSVEGQLAAFIVVAEDITERKQAEEALRATASSLSASQRVAHLGSWEIDLSQSEDFETAPHRCSDELYRILGYEPNSVPASAGFFLGNIPPEYRSEVKKEITALIADRQEHTFTHPIVRPSGERRYIRSVAQAVVDEKSGRLLQVFGTAQDITDSMIAEESLRATASSLAVSQSIAHLGSWEMDLVNLDNLRANPLRWSDEMYRIFGYLPQSVPVTPDFYFQHVPGEERHLIEQRLHELIRDHTQRSYFYPVTRSGGERRIVHTQAHVLLDEKTGRPQKLLGTIHDVTDVKGHEEQILAETALLEAQLNSTLDGILVVDTNGRQVLQNQRMIDLWKIPPHIIHESDQRRRLEWFSRQEKNSEALIEKVMYLSEHPDEITRDETELNDGRFFDRYSAPVRGADGRLYGRIWVFRDITERKRSDQKMAEQMQLLTMAGRVGKLGAWAAEYPGPKLIWSDEVYRMHEVEPGFELTRESTVGFFTPESRRKLEAAIDRRQPFDLELDIVTAKGKKRTLRVTGKLEASEAEAYRLYGICQDITDRKQQEARMRRLIDSNVVCVLIWKKDGAVTEANDAFCHLVGYSRQDLVSGRINWMQLTPPEHARLDEQALQEIAERGVCAPYEKCFIRKDGVRVPILLGAAVFEDNPDEGVAFMIDLTEQKRTETRFNKMVESNAQGVMFWKASGPITGGNDAFLRLVGYTREDLEAGRIDWRALTPPEYLAADQHALEDIAVGGACRPMEKEWIRKDGSRVPVYLSAGSFEDTPGEGVIFALDLTERKRIESRFRRLIDSNVQSVTFWKRGGEVTEANDAFLNLVGYSREDLQAGRINWRTLTPPEYVEADNRAMEEVAANGICKTYEKEYIRKNGSRVPVLIGAAAFEDNPDEGVRFVLDLTEIKKLENQFLRAQRMESIGTLAGGIAHDLNNILAPIMMAVQVLKMKTTEPQAKSILETIEVSSKRGADIVRQVLSFARGLQGERVEVQPVHLLKDIETIIRDTFPKDIRRDVFFPENAWTILGDPTQLHQILLNLCVNARDAMPEGGTLSISAENAFLDDQYAAMNIQAKAGKYVIINVTDSGQGIAPDILDKIFDPFFTTKEVGKGTGLGLSTVMAIVKSHGGFVNVYSEVGRGSSFKVYLPALETSARSQRDTVSLGALPRGNGERILIVDDETSILSITSETLEAFGYKTITASDGAEAIAIYAQHQNKIAVILTDMAMPVMDGPATIRALQRVNPDVKIIAATGLKNEASEVKALNAGVKHFLSKPYTASTLLKTLRTVLDEAKRAA